MSTINVCTFVACMQDVRVITKMVHVVRVRVNSKNHLGNYNYNITITQGYSCVHVYMYVFF